MTRLTSSPHVTLQPTLPEQIASAHSHQTAMARPGDNQEESPRGIRSYADLRPPWWALPSVRCDMKSTPITEVPQQRRGAMVASAWKNIRCLHTILVRLTPNPNTFQASF